MSTVMNVHLQQIKDLVLEAVDLAVVERGRRRQVAVWGGESTDYLPLLLGHTEVNAPGLNHNRMWKLAEHELVGGAQVPEFFDYPHYSPAEQWESPKKMLYEFLWEILSWARSKSDAQLAIRPNILPIFYDAFGAQLASNEQFGVYIGSHPSKEVLRDIDPARIEEGTLFRKLLDFSAFFVENSPPGVPVYPANTGGPLTSALKLRGDALYTDFYDDPEFVHDLVEKCADMCIRAGLLLKTVVGEDRTSGYHGSLFMAHGSVRIADDYVVMISPKHHREFVIPAIRRVLQAFGGGWYHSCGYWEPHLDNLLDVPEIVALNTCDPHLWDFDELLRRIIQAGKVYYGGLPIGQGGDARSLMRRAMEATGRKRKGMILMLHGQGPWPRPQTTLELWHDIQDEYEEKQ